MTTSDTSFMFVATRYLRADAPDAAGSQTRLAAYRELRTTTWLQPGGGTRGLRQRGRSGDAVTNQPGLGFVT